MVISPRHAILMDSINQTYVVAIDGLVWRVTLIIFLVERKDIRRIPLKYPMILIDWCLERQSSSIRQEDTRRPCSSRNTRQDRV